MARLIRSVTSRLFARTNFDGPVPAHRPELGPCWEYNGYRQQGYGRLQKTRGRMVLAHRESFEYFKGPVPEGLPLDHLCRNTACCNPSHLEPVTTQENTLRGTSLPAYNILKTHCLRGHELQGENLYVQPNGSRVCKECREKRMEQHRLSDGYAQRQSERTTRPEQREKARLRAKAWYEANRDRAQEYSRRKKAENRNTN